MKKNYTPVTTAQELHDALCRCRNAQKKFATYSQEKVDQIFLAAATAANRMRIPSARSSGNNFKLLRQNLFSLKLIS